MNKIISLDSLQRLIIAPLKRLIDKKVEKVDGKGLSTNDFTDEYKEKLVSLNTDGLVSKEYVDGQLSNISDQFNNLSNHPDIIPLVSTNKQVLTEAQQHQTRENLGLYYTDDTVIEILPEISLEYKVGQDEDGEDYKNSEEISGNVLEHRFEVGKTYIVIYDNVTYKCIAYSDDFASETTYLGCRDIPYSEDGVYPDPETKFSEPFLFIQVPWYSYTSVRAIKPGIHTISVSLVESSVIKFTNEYNIAEFGRNTRSVHKQLVTDGEGAIRLDNKLAYAVKSSEDLYCSRTVEVNHSGYSGSFDIKPDDDSFKIVEFRPYKIVYNGVSYECIAFSEKNSYYGGTDLFLRVDGVIEIIASMPPNSNSIRIHTLDGTADTEVSFELYYLNDGIKHIDEQFMPVGTVIAPVTTDDNGKIMRVVDGVWKPEDNINNYIAFIDQVNGYKYIVCMRNGELVSYCATQSISVTTPPIKTEYLDGDVFNPDGMVVTATAYDGTTREITNYTYEDRILKGNTILIIKYVENGKTYATSTPITVQ